MPTYLTLATIMILSGLLGGIINYFLVHQPKEDFSKSYIFLKSLLLGLGASLLVPLFLHIIGSNLLPVNNENIPQNNYFVFAGFCLIASILSKRFIEDLYSRVINAEKEAQEAKNIAKEAKQTSQDIEEFQTESEDSEDLTVATGVTESSSKVIDPKTLKYKAIIEAIQKSRYAFRTITGIAKEVGGKVPEIEALLNELEEKSILRSKKNKKGNKIFGINRFGITDPSVDVNI